MFRVLVVMEDTLLAEALVGQLGQLPAFEVRVVSGGSHDVMKEAELFAPQIVLTDRHPSSAMLRESARFRAKIAVVTPRESPITLYQVSQQDVSNVQDVVALLAQSSANGEPALEPAGKGSSMPYARITRLYAMEGQAHQLQRLLDGYLDWLGQRPGFVLGLALSPTRDDKSLARVAVWGGGAGPTPRL